MLLTLTLGWIGARIWTWDFPPPDQRTMEARVVRSQAPIATTGLQTEPAIERPFDAGGEVAPANIGPQYEQVRRNKFRPPARVFPPAQRSAKSTLLPVAPASPALQEPDDVTPQFANPTFVDDPADSIGPAKVPNSARRLSLDAWAFWRQGSRGLATTIGRSPTYGASQLGGILQYRLDPSSKRDPRFFVRAYRALVPQGETELSAGASARPLRGVPVRLHAEVRATERPGAPGSQIDFRPAVFATSELPPLQLPLGSRFEAYAQAGYVGGNGATAFADGQMSLLHNVTRFSIGRLSGGAGAWAAAQEGASRVDVGPSLRFDTELGKVPVRVTADYRARVAGDAKPDSGFAVSLSSGF